jgi:hypothetical protein
MRFVFIIALKFDLYFKNLGTTPTFTPDEQILVNRCISSLSKVKINLRNSLGFDDRISFVLFALLVGRLIC